MTVDTTSNKSGEGAATENERRGIPEVTGRSRLQRTGVDAQEAATRDRLKNPDGALAAATGEEDMEELPPDAIQPVGPEVIKFSPDEVANVREITVLLEGDENDLPIIEVDGIQFGTPQDLAAARNARRATGTRTVAGTYSVEPGQTLVLEPGVPTPKIKGVPTSRRKVK